MLEGKIEDIVSKTHALWMKRTGRQEKNSTILGRITKIKNMGNERTTTQMVWGPIDRNS